jgi:hypothetical protein
MSNYSFAQPHCSARVHGAPVVALVVGATSAAEQLPRGKRRWPDTASRSASPTSVARPHSVAGHEASRERELSDDQRLPSTPPMIMPETPGEVRLLFQPGSIFFRAFHSIVLFVAVIGGVVCSTHTCISAVGFIGFNPAHD